MKLHVAGQLLLLAICGFTKKGFGAPMEPQAPTLLGGIGNVASSATNFLVNAVEKPKNFIINATRVTTGYVDSAASKGLEFGLKRFLHKFRRRMCCGIPEFGMPVLEPLRVEQLIVESENEEIGFLRLEVDDLIMNHLSTFAIDRAKMSLIGPTITVNLSIPEIYATGHYNISGMLGGMFPLRGDGPFALTIYGFRIYANTVIGYSKGLYMKVFDLDFSLKSIALRLENFMGGDKIGKIMNQVIEELTPEALEIMKPDILPGIQNFIAMRINDTIHHLTMRDLFHALLKENDIRDLTHLIVP